MAADEPHPGPFVARLTLRPPPAMAPLSSEVLLLSTPDLACLDLPCRLLAASSESLTALKSVCTALPRLLVTPRCGRQFRAAAAAASLPASLKTIRPRQCCGLRLPDVQLLALAANPLRSALITTTRLIQPLTHCRAAGRTCAPPMLCWRSC